MEMRNLSRLLELRAEETNKDQRSDGRVALFVPKDIQHQLCKDMPFVQVPQNCWFFSSTNDLTYRVHSRMAVTIKYKQLK
jgi:hypothetical protein